MTYVTCCISFVEIAVSLDSCIKKIMTPNIQENVSLKPQLFTLLSFPSVDRLLIGLFSIAFSSIFGVVQMSVIQSSWFK